jgi:hypothetical protein
MVNLQIVIDNTKLYATGLVAGNYKVILREVIYYDTTTVNQNLYLRSNYLRNTHGNTTDIIIPAIVDWLSDGTTELITTTRYNREFHCYLTDKIDIKVYNAVGTEITPTTLILNFDVELIK